MFMRKMNPPERLPSMGRIVATPAVLEAVPRPELMAALQRHMCCDWGEISESDWRVNDQAFKKGERLLSSYKSSRGTRFWILTEPDRSVTTVLLPSDY